ncbi:hypothetical protein CRUP_023503 [Coryphaenoides rupestris]|nr:hypothetical protein CRUP_023503 [Coryphaenoides rupestris]
MLAEASLSIGGWGGLGVVLFLITFGPFAIFYLAFYILCFIGGFIDEPLQQVIQYALRDYIQYWYYTLSEDESFLLEIRQTLQNALVQFSTRSKEVDWQPYVTTRLVDDFATHLREVLARGVLLPLINQLSDPDYINQFVIWMIRDSSCNYEAFMNILKLTDRPPELEAVKDKVLEELQYLRSLDTAGDDINVIKNQINSLLFVKKVCETRIQRLHSGKEVDALKLAANFGKLCIIPLDHILVHNIALQLNMQAAGAQAGDCSSVLTVGGVFRVSSRPQQLRGMQALQRDGKQQPSSATKGLLKAAAQGVYEQYLSEKRYYPSFKQSPLYVRMLAELDMLKEPSYRGSDDGDGESFNGSPTGSINLNKAYNKGKGDFARKMDTFVNPLRSSMRNVSNVVKALPDSLAEGMNKVPPMLPKSDIDPEHCRVLAQLDDNVDDNIPLRVMLLLMDEVFDLKEKNQWLRRNIKNLLQQLIRATYGDTINRDSYWPNGILAETPPTRDRGIRMRTRVAAKTNLLGIMPDELKHIIGAETTRKGILRIFDMFQHQPMNRRLVYVFLEGFLETMFPQYKFPELFVKLHSRSLRTHRYSQKLKGASLKR